MIDENKLMTNIQELIVSQTSIDGRNYQDELINSYNEALHDVLKTIEEQPKVNEWLLDRINTLERDKSVLEIALDKACEKLEELSYVKGLGQAGMCYAEWKELFLKENENDE